MKFTELKENKIFCLSFKTIFTSLAFAFACVGYVTTSLVIIGIAGAIIFALKLHPKFDEREKYLSYKALNIGLFPLIAGLALINVFVAKPFVPFSFYIFIIAWSNAMPLFTILKNNR